MKCPYCNEYEADNSGSIIAHAVGKRDDPHSGLAYQEVKAKVEATDETESIEADETENRTDAESGNSGASAFDAPDTGGTITMSETEAEDAPDLDLSLVAGQRVRGTDGNVYETEQGDEIGEDGIELVGGQAIETTSGYSIETERGDCLE